MDSRYMHAYRSYRLAHCEDEMRRQRNLLFCDGRMQEYLQARWSAEPDVVKQLVEDRVFGTKDFVDDSITR